MGEGTYKPLLRPLRWASESGTPFSPPTQFGRAMHDLYPDYRPCGPCCPRASGLEGIRGLSDSRGWEAGGVALPFSGKAGPFSN